MERQSSVSITNLKHDKQTKKILVLRYHKAQNARNRDGLKSIQKKKKKKDKLSTEWDIRVTVTTKVRKELNIIFKKKKERK